jgi:preprotein translocase subunit SecG
MNMIIALLTSSTILLCIMFIVLVFALNTKTSRARVRKDMKRIKSQITNEMPEAEW